MPPTEQVNNTLEEIFQRHERVVLWVSGGKDSLTLMHLCQPWREQVTLVHNAVDDGFPGVRENLILCVADWGFTKVCTTSPPISFEDYVQQYGWPVDVVPTAMDGISITPYTYGVKVSSWWSCTVMRQIAPLLQQTAILGADAVLTGSRGSDAPAFETMGPTADGREPYGWMRYNPLYDWSTKEIWAYIEAHQIPLPPHYQWKKDATFEWPDCQRCTWQPKYLRFLRDHQPAQYEALMKDFRPTELALRTSIAIYHQDLEDAHGE